MRLRLNDEQEMVRSTAVRALADLVPIEHLASAERSGDGVDTEVWTQIVELGWPTMALSETAGGTGASLIDCGLVIEQVGWSGWASPVLDCMVATTLLGSLGDPAAAHAAGMLADGGLVALSGAIGPVVARSHVDGATVLLNAAPHPVRWATRADRLLVVARDDSGDGFTVAVVGADEPGVRVRDALSLDNERIGVVALVGAEVPTASLLARMDLKALDAWLAPASALHAAWLLGTAKRLLALSIEYTQARQQFGRQLATLPSVQHACADSAIEIDAAELATHQALSCLDAGVPAAAAAVTAVEAAGTAATNGALRAAQLHGAIGFMQEYHLQYFFRRAKAGQLRFGSTGERRDRLARVLLEAVDESGAELPIRGLGPGRPERGANE